MAIYLLGPARKPSFWRERSGDVDFGGELLPVAGPIFLGAWITLGFGDSGVVRVVAPSRSTSESSTRVAERLTADLSALDGSRTTGGAVTDAKIPDFVLSACRLATRLTCSSSSGTC